MKKIIYLSLFCIPFVSFAQKKQMIKIVDDKQKNEVVITINNKPFTSLMYSDTLYKPFLYPVYSPKGQLVTRGYPLAPRDGEPVDHPHHTGIWFNYENVNGLDFWNNSFAIPSEKKNSYGSIKHTKITAIKSGNEGNLTIEADWVDSKNNVLLKEKTNFVFSATATESFIDRYTTLTAEQDVAFADAKDGLLGLRVAKELQIPTIETKKFTDDKGIVTTVKAIKDSTINGNYITSEGKEGDSAWSTRGKWCLLYGKKNNEMISIAIIDHPKNINYPTYWHARGYGLFAANPLGAKVFSNGKQTLNYKLTKGQSVTFRYRIVVAGGKERLSNDALDKLADEFATK
ncbi:MAG: hypothetical protein C0459_02205 [Chitinophaga sp.]|nr:hypothetical protein [Chitinophaga sp.]